MNGTRLTTLALLAALAPLAGAQYVPTVIRQAAPHPKECAQVVVVLQAGMTIGPVALQAAGLVLASDPLTNVHLIESGHSMPGAQADAYAAQVASMPGVALAELLHAVTLPEAEACALPSEVSGQQCTVAFADGTPSDAEFHQQWNLESINYKYAQGLSEHEPVLVAIIDTGVDGLHPALAGQVVPGWDFLTDKPGGMDLLDGADNDEDGLVDEAFGHGTHLSSTVLLVNPDARILPLRVLDADGNGNSFDVAEAIFYAIHHGAQVINLSLSMKTASSTVALAMEYANYRGVPIFAAAGNTGKKKVLFPASYDARTFKPDVPFLPVGWKPSSETVTAVAAGEMWGVKASFSAWGPAVDIVAPGVDIYGAMPGGGYAWWSGTSQATAVASGVGSLMISVGGTDMPMPPQHIMLITAEPIDSLNPQYAGGLGKGYVDAWYAAWTAASFH